MRIACVGNAWFPEASSGLERYLDATARELTTLGHNVDLFVVGAPQAWDARSRAIALAPADASTPARLIGAARVLAREARRPYDVVNMHFAMYAWQTYLAVPRATARVVTFHGPWADESHAEFSNAALTRALLTIERSVYCNSDRFIVLSEAFRDILSDRYGVDKSLVDVIPGGVDIDRFRSDSSRREARMRLGWRPDLPTAFVARRLVRRTGVIELIEAVQRVVARGVRLQVMIAGRGYLEDEIRTTIARAGLADTVKLLGFIPDEQLPLAYRAADFVVVPSQDLEGFGLTVVEALACGTPPLVTPVGGLPEVVGPFAPQLVLPDASAEAIAEGIVRLLSAPDWLPSAFACRAYATGNFSWDRISRAVETVFERASGQNARELPAPALL